MLIRSEDRYQNKGLIMKLNCMCQTVRLRSVQECQVRKYITQKEGREWEEIGGEEPWEDGDA